MRHSYGIPIGLFLAALLGLVSRTGLAAPAAIEMKDGRTIKAEIVGYTDGKFELRDKDGKESTASPEEVKSVRFREPSPARALKVDEVQRRAEEHRFPLIYAVFQTNVNLTGPARVTQIEKELADRLSRTDLTREARRDLSLAQVVACIALDRHDKVDELMAKVRADYPKDLFVQQFDAQRRRGFERPVEKGRPAATSTTLPARAEKRPE